MANEIQRKTFLSYSRTNKDFAVKLANELKSEGFDIWFDQLDIPPGSRWDAEIEKALEESDIFMVIITPASAKSENVLDEIGYAIDSGKRILPVLLETATLPLRLRRFQYVDFTSKSFNEGIKSAKELLRTLIAQPTIPDGEVPVDTQAQAEAETEATRQKKPLARGPMIGVIAAVIFGFAGIGYAIFSKGAGSNSPAVSPATETSVIATSIIVEPSATSTIVQPSATSTLSNTPDPTIASTPINADTVILAAYVQSALTGDMKGEAGVRIEHPLASESDSLIFVTPNFEGPDSPGIYNDYPVCVYFYGGSQWVILNLKQDFMAIMDYQAAFNVQILKEGKDAFIHTATTENTPDTPGYWTAIDSKKYPLATNPNALVFATYNYSASTGSGQTNNHPIGVWYTGTEWAIYNRDLNAMPEGTAFNVRIVSPDTNGTLIHTVMSSNIRYINTTAIDNPNPFFHDPNLLAFAMPRVSAGSTPEKYDLNIGVFHNGSEWTIFNQDRTQPMPEGAEFNILLLEPR